MNYKTCWNLTQGYDECDEIKHLRAALAAKDAEIERIKKNHGCARQQGTTQFCHEALDAHKEADAMRADAALGAAVRRMKDEQGIRKSGPYFVCTDESGDFAEETTPEAAMAHAGLMKGEGE